MVNDANIQNNREYQHLWRQYCGPHPNTSLEHAKKVSGSSIPDFWMPSMSEEFLDHSYNVVTRPSILMSDLDD